MQTHSIGVTESAVWSLIEDQAAGWKQAVREAGQNGIDAENSSEVRITYNKRFTAVRDNGSGRDLSDPDEIDNFTNMGETTKADDDDLIGEFGLGLGQVFATGVVKIVSGTQALIYDVKRRGVGDGSVIQVEIPDEHRVDGVLVVMYHYDDQVPDQEKKWEQYEESINNRFKYLSLTMSTEFYVNGECISYNHPREVVRNEMVCGYIETEHAYIGLYQDISDDISVYSNGIYVKDISYHGFGGVIVSKQNLNLDLSRNDIKESCELWSTIERERDQLLLDICEDEDQSNLNNLARKNFVKNIITYDREDLYDMKILRDIKDSPRSINDARNKDRVLFAGSGNIEADKLASEGELVLNKDDYASKYVSRRTEKLGINRATVDNVKEEYDALSDGYTVYNDLELNTWRRCRLGIARELVDRFGSERNVFWGKDQKARAWTDGRKKIVITDKIFKSSTKSAWLAELWDTLVHELAHEKETKGACTHGNSFNRQFQKLKDETRAVYRNFAEDLEDNGIKHYEIENTKYEQERLDQIRHTLRYKLEEGDEFYKNRDERCSTVLESNIGSVVFRGPRGGEWEVTLERGSRMIAVNTENGNEQEITHIEQKT